jgi:PqqD family protein of HPr-rel-A system
LVAKKVGQEFMLYDPEKDCVHVLNPTAYRIHQLLGEGLGPEAIAAALRSEFGLAPDHPVMADVQEGIHSLERLGLA